MNRFIMRPWGVLTVVLVIALCRSLPAQTPEAPRSTLTPEQMVEEAIRRFDAGDMNEAYAYVQKVRALNPELSRLKLIEGLLFLEARPKKGPEAIAKLSDYNQTSEGKNDYRGNAALGRVYKESYMYQLALRPLEKAQKIAPIDQDGKPVRAIITLDLAECYFGMKKEKQALTTAKEAEALAPNDSDVQLQLAKIAANTKDFETALKATDRALGILNAKSKSNPFKVEDTKNMEDCVDSKIRILVGKLEGQGKTAQTQYDLAVALREKAEILRRANLIRAREYGLKGIANDSKLFKLQVFVATVEAELGGIQEAIDRLNDTINNDPENQAAIKLRSDLQARLAASRT